MPMSELVCKNNLGPAGGSALPCHRSMGTGLGLKEWGRGHGLWMSFTSKPLEIQTYEANRDWTDDCR